MVGLFEYADGRLTRVRGELADLVVGGGTYEASGIQCLEDNGHRLVRSRIVHAEFDSPTATPSQYVLWEVTYAADGSGRLVKTAEERFTFPPGDVNPMPAQLADVAGVHGPGVSDLSGS